MTAAAVGSRRHGRDPTQGSMRHTPRKCEQGPFRDPVLISEPPKGIEPLTYSLRVNRSAD